MSFISKSFRSPRRFLLAGLFALAAAGQTAVAETATQQPETLGGQPVVQIVTGWEHSCARVATGRVWCWGLNSTGQLGIGNTTASALPVLLPGLTSIIQLAAGRAHTCALNDRGRVFCWGFGDDGQLGQGLRQNSPRPVRVRGLTNATQIAAGSFHSCALRSNGRVSCWGFNGWGQLGDGTTTRALTPVRAEGRWGRQGVQIVAGPRHSCLLRRNGTVACWGENSFGQIGNGSMTGIQTLPGRVRRLSAVTQLAAGTSHNCAVRDSGRVFCWGRNFEGALGDGTTINRGVPVRVRNLSAAVQVTAGGEDGHSCAIRDTGQLFCWGWNEYGTIGDGSTTSRLTPRRVAGLSGVSQVSAGGFHTCGLRSVDSRVFCWGRNTHGQLGDGTTTDRLRPSPVAD